MPPLIAFLPISGDPCFFGVASLLLSMATLTSAFVLPDIQFTEPSLRPEKRQFQNDTLAQPNIFVDDTTPTDSRRIDAESNLTLVLFLYAIIIVTIILGFLRGRLSLWRNNMFRHHNRKFPTKNSTTPGRRKPSTFSRAVARIQANVTLPALFGERHVATVGGIASLPTRLQAVLVGAFGLVVLIMAVVDLRGREQGQSMTRYLAIRTGYLSTGLLPIVILLSGKTTFLQRATGWSGSAIGVFHRWIARGCVFLAVIHSVCFAYIKADVDKKGIIGMFNERRYMTGTVATCLMGALVVFSILPIRQKFYDAFIMSHICLTIVGVGFLWDHLGVSPNAKSIRGYVYAAVVIYILQRIFRLLNLLSLNSNGGQPARVTVIKGTPVLKLTVYPTDPIPFFPGSHFYVYMKTKKSLGHFRLYESHPFTAVSYRRTLKNNSSSPNVVNSKLTFLIKPQAGLTRHFTNLLAAQPKLANGTPATKADISVLIEGPYGTHHPVMTYNTILLIAGGIGISAVLPHIRSYFLLLANPITRRDLRTRKVVLVWSCRGYELFRKIWRREILPILTEFQDTCKFSEEEGGDIVALMKTFEPHFYINVEGEQEMQRMPSTKPSNKGRSRQTSVSTASGAPSSSSKGLGRSDTTKTTSSASSKETTGNSTKSKTSSSKNTTNSRSKPASSKDAAKSKRPTLPHNVTHSSSTYAPSTSPVPFTLSYERCNIERFMQDEFDRCLGKWGCDGRQMAVVVCGPGRFVDDVRRFVVVGIKRDVDKEKALEEERRREKEEEKARRRERRGRKNSKGEVVIEEEEEDGNGEGGSKQAKKEEIKKDKKEKGKEEEKVNEVKRFKDVEIVVNGRKQIQQIEVKEESVVRCGVGYFEESFG